MASSNDPRRLLPLLAPRSVVVVGASHREGSLGRKVLLNLREAEFPGDVMAVHPSHEEVEGYRCVQSLLDLPATPDCAVICVSSTKVLGVLREAQGLGVPAAVVVASGFAESIGADLEDELRSFCQASGMMVCGPNCLGIINVKAGATLYTAAKPMLGEAGHVALVSQSGAASIAVSAAGRLAFSYIVSSGNEAGLTLDDYIRFLAADSQTRAIGIVVEAIRNPVGFATAARAAHEAGKPVIALKIGRSVRGMQAAQSHTGAIISTPRVYEAFLRKHGVLLVDDLDELIETLSLLSTCAGTSAGREVGFATVSGGEAGIICDLAERTGVGLAELEASTVSRLRELLPDYVGVDNPLDLGGVGVENAEAYEACVLALAEDRNVGVVAIAHDSPAAMNERQSETYGRLIAALPRVASKVDKPVVQFSNVSGTIHRDLARPLEGSSVAQLRGTRESLAALTHLIEFSHHQRTRGWDPPPVPAAAISGRALRWKRELKGREGLLTFEENQRLLREYGIGVVDGGFASSARQAADIADALGYPVVVKVEAVGLVHKTEVSGVRLDLRSREGVQRAAQETKEAFDGLRSKDGSFRGWVVQKMVTSLAEGIVGVTREAPFGSVLMLGPGGLLVDLLGDRMAIRLLPSGEAEIRDLVLDGPLGTLLSGFRGASPGDVDAFVDLAARAGRLAYELNDVIEDLDLNPVAILEQGRGAVVLDSKVIVSSSTQE